MIDLLVKNFDVKVKKYAPIIFHDIRKIDNISLHDVIRSLDPNTNMKIIKESFASGGRSANPIIFSYDKKYLLKAIAKSEITILMKLLPELHRRMKNSKSYVCRVYGVFSIKNPGKENVNILLMRNMNELPNEVFL
jgi:hypothetical protein